MKIRFFNTIADINVVAIRVTGTQSKFCPRGGIVLHITQFSSGIDEICVYCAYMHSGVWAIDPMSRNLEIHVKC